MASFFCDAISTDTTIADHQLGSVGRLGWG